ncbi:MAG: matrixin family metalloprotease [Acidobacteriota bacterium]|nr:matrixin family metalloprotease [Acidobacteriota bacterium]
MRCQILAACLSIATILPGATIHLKNRDVKTRADRNSFRGESLKRRSSSKSHYLLQFPGPITSDEVDQLNARGAAVTSAVPDNALMVVAADGFSVEGLDVEWAGRLRPADKLSSALPDSGSGIPGVFVVEFHSDADMDAGREMAIEANLSLLERDDLLSNELLVSGTAGAVSALADWDEVDYIFPASDDLALGIPLIACAGALTAQGTVAQYAIVGHGWSPDAANGVQLKYVFDGLTSRVPDQTTEAEIARALQEWTKYANVQFAPSASSSSGGTSGDAFAPRTIRITFATGDHGDGYPFQPFGSALAHTFYPAPPNAEPLAGDMHLNEEERWHSGANIDIFTVALHEAGHALGLGHSDKPGAIMYPYYRLGASISTDDIAGIQALYGAAVDSTPAEATRGNPAPPVAAATPSLLTVAVRNPASAAVETLADTLLVSGIAADGIGETTVAWQTDHGAAGNATGSTTWSIRAVPLSVGLNTITLTAADSTHHTASTTLSVTRKSAPAGTAGTPGSGKTAPSIHVTSPNTTIVSTNSATISVRGTASDNAGVVNVTWLNALGGSQGIASGTDEWTASGIPLYPGTNTIIVRAFNAAGNSSWRSLTVIRK